MKEEEKINKIKEEFQKQKSKIYKSKRWKKIRDEIYVRDNGICQICGKMIEPTEIRKNVFVYGNVDHKIEIDNNNIKDDDIVYNKENLQLLCLSCHKRKSQDLKFSEGKTYVLDNMGEIDFSYQEKDLKFSKDINNLKTEDIDNAEEEIKNFIDAEEKILKDKKYQVVVNGVIRHNYIDMYIDFVNQNKIPICEKLKLQISRIQKFLKDDRYYFDIEESNKPINFIEKFEKHEKGPLIGQTMKISLWEKFYISCIYGILKKEDNLRLCNEFLLLIARKNNKTSISAGLAMYHLMMDNDGPEVYCLANTKNQSKILYDKMYNISFSSKKISKRLKLRKSDLQNLKNNGSAKYLASDSSNLDGLNASVAFFDELHEFKDENLIDVIETSTGARSNPLIVFMTTNGIKRNGVFDKRYSQYSDILYGKVEDNSVFPFIYELEDENEIADPKNWIKANPNIGKSVLIKNIKKSVIKIITRPESRAGILCKIFNLPQNSNSAFFSKEECEINNFEYNKEIRKNVFGGLDMSFKNDLSCLSFKWKELGKDGNENHFLKQWYFMPKGMLSEKIIKDKIDYKKFVESGELILLDGVEINQDVLYTEILRIVDENNFIVQRFCIDSFRADLIINKLRNSYGHNFVNSTDIKWAQAMTKLIYSFRNNLRNRRIFYNEKMFSINLANVGAKISNDDLLKIEKFHHTGRIDGFHSCIYSFKAEQLFNMGYVNKKKK